MSDQFVRALLGEQRNRAIATIMGYVDQNLKQSLSTKQRSELRDQILAAVNTYHGCVVDCMKVSVNDGSLVNEHAIDLIFNMNEGLKRLARQLTHKEGS